MAKQLFNPEHFSKLVGMLGSAHDGERASAARAADRYLKDHKLSWSDVVGRPRRSNARDDQPTVRDGPLKCWSFDAAFREGRKQGLKESEARQADALVRGRADGYEDGYKEGYVKGYLEGRKFERETQQQLVEKQQTEQVKQPIIIIKEPRRPKLSLGKRSTPQAGTATK